MSKLSLMLILRTRMSDVSSCSSDITGDECSERENLHKHLNNVTLVQKQSLTLFCSDGKAPMPTLVV